VLSKIDELDYLYGAKYQAISYAVEELGLSDEIIGTCKEVGIHDRSEFNDAALERMGVNPRLRSDFTRLLKQFLTKMKEEAARLKAAESKKGGRRWSRLNVAKRDSKYRANKKSIAKKFKKCISRKLRLNRKV
jgi:mannitol-1-phosphate/altronate dehydrogenase